MHDVTSMRQKIIRKLSVYTKVTALSSRDIRKFNVLTKIFFW